MARRKDEGKRCVLRRCEYYSEGYCAKLPSEKYPQCCPRSDESDEEKEECKYIHTVTVKEKDGRSHRSAKSRRRSRRRRLSRYDNSSQETEGKFCLNPEFEAKFCLVEYANEKGIGLRDCPYSELEEEKKEKVTERTHNKEG